MAAKKMVRLTPGQMARALELSRDRVKRLRASLQYAHNVLEHAGNALDGKAPERLMALIADAITDSARELRVRSARR